MRAKSNPRNDATLDIDEQTSRRPMLPARQARRRWAALIKQVWQVDPLRMPPMRPWHEDRQLHSAHQSFTFRVQDARGMREAIQEQAETIRNIVAEAMNTRRNVRDVVSRAAR